jgi:hypothetical protein
VSAFGLFLLALPGLLAIAWVLSIVPRRDALIALAVVIYVALASALVTGLLP